MAVTMRANVIRLVLALTATAAFGQGWVGQQMVSRPDSWSDQAPCVAMDASGNPWVMWDRNSDETTLYYSRWLGDSWGIPVGVGRNAPGLRMRLNTSLAFDDEDHVWAVWCNAFENNMDDIGASVWADTSWSSEIQVNLPDSTELDFMPKVACGGGQVWCVWYGGPTDMSPYSVFASRWYDSAGFWYPEMQVSPPDGTYHWWCDLAVDANGTPHVVWCNSSRRLILYSYFDGAGWLGPTAVNDTVAVGATGWSDPHIAIDNAGVLHVCYTGVAQGATGRDIFYSRNDGTGWTPSVRVTSDTAHNYNEWYSDIAADRPDNVWVAWDRQGEGSDGFRVYAAHYDGNQWSPEQRLDDSDSMSYDDHLPDISLDGQGEPWVVWQAVSYLSGDFDVYYNRFTSAGLQDASNQSTFSEFELRCATLSPGQPIAVTYTLQAPSHINLRVFDQVGRCVANLAEGNRAAGIHSTLWRGNSPSGVYFCRLSAEKCMTTQKIVLTGR